MKLIKSIAVFSLIGFLSACSHQDEKTIATVGEKQIQQEDFNAFLDLKRVNVKDEKQVNAYLKQYLDREALTTAIEESKVLEQKNIQAELNEFKKEMLIGRYFQTYLKDKVTDEGIRNYYANHAEQFQSKKVNVSHILIRTSKNMSEEERKVKYTRAHEAYSKLKSGASFESVVAEFSEDTVSAKKQGNIGWITEGAIDPVFSKKVFTEMKKDEISEPFQTSFGFHVVKLIEAPAVVTQPFEKVSGDIRHQLRKAAKDAELERLMTSVSIKRM